MSSLNLVILSGTITAEPSFEYSAETGKTSARILVTTLAKAPNRRIDVLPAIYRPISDEDHDRIADLRRGDGVWVTGSLRRSPGQGANMVEFVATDVQIKERTV